MLILYIAFQNTIKFVYNKQETRHFFLFFVRVQHLFYVLTFCRSTALYRLWLLQQPFSKLPYHLQASTIPSQPLKWDHSHHSSTSTLASPFLLPKNLPFHIILTVFDFCIHSICPSQLNLYKLNNISDLNKGFKILILSY